MDLGLSGRVAIVTGASKGLGLGAARALAAEGAKLVLCARGSAAAMLQLCVAGGDQYGHGSNAPISGDEHACVPAQRSRNASSLVLMIGLSRY